LRRARPLKLPSPRSSRAGNSPCGLGRPDFRQSEQDVSMIPVLGWMGYNIAAVPSCPLETPPNKPPYCRHFGPTHGRR
jgi:hypothetical protein